MRFFEHCRGYVEGVEKNRTALAEVEKFKHGEEMEGVRRRLAEKLGLPQHHLTPGQTGHPVAIETQAQATLSSAFMHRQAALRRMDSQTD